jgi:hypothetical protein
MSYSKQFYDLWLRLLVGVQLSNKWQIGSRPKPPLKGTGLTYSEGLDFFWYLPSLFPLSESWNMYCREV